MPARSTLVIDLSRLRLRALLSQPDGRILRVRKTLVEDVPNDLHSAEPEAIGAWVGEALRSAGFPRGWASKAVIALPREHAVLKRLALPTNDENELPEMTRLAMGRELPFDAQTAAIDFIPVERSDTTTTVLAIAVKNEAIDHALRIAKAARIRVERISLRNLGSAMLLRHLGEETRQSILAVDIIGDSVEFCVIDSAGSEGTVRFSRAAESIPWRDIDLVVDSISTETRRTWMSYRITEDSTEVRHVVVMGEKRVAREVAGPIGEMLNVDAEVLSAHPLVDASGHEMDRLWPLAGLLLEPMHGGATIDLAHPRKAPDLAAQRRKRVFFAAAATFLVMLAVWTLAKRDLDSLRAHVAAAEQRATGLYPDYVRHHRDEYRLRHIEQWKAARADWLEHIMYLTAIAPQPGEVVLDNWTGRLNFTGVTFNRSTREWAAPMQVLIEISGEAHNRATADRFRDALVRTAVYSTTSTGADAPQGGRRLSYGFAYRLRTQSSAPDEIEARQIGGTGFPPARAMAQGQDARAAESDARATDGGAP